MELIERESGLAGRILRPLSAHHFPPTLPEEKGIVDRGRLLAISCRSRKDLIALAEELDVRDYPYPAGGCLLTDQDITGHLRDLFADVSGYAHRDLVLLNIGRHFRLSPLLQVILGQSQEENEKLLALAAPGDVVFTPENFRGPTALAMGESEPATEGIVGEMIPACSQDDLGTCLIRKEVIGGGSVTFTGPGKRMRDTFAPLQIGRD